MKVLVSIVAAVALLLASAHDVAVAAPALVQATCQFGSGLATLAFTAAPTNGNVVVGMGAANALGSGSTMKDSNNVSYPQRIFNSTTANLSEWDNTVAGSPTATYTYSVVGSEYCQYEYSGVTDPGTYAQANTATTSTSATIASGVKAGDAILCLGETASGNFTSLSMTNGTITVDDGGSGAIYAFGHGFATATASTSCSTVQGATGATVFIIDLTAPAAGGVTYGCYPKAGAYPGCRVGDVIFDLLVRTV